MATKVERHLLRINADRSINVETDIPIVAGSIGVDEVLITFEEPEDWQDMSLTVTMVSSVVDTPYTVLWDGVSAFNVPWELTQEVGVIGFSVLGISSSSQTYQRGLTQSSVGLITIVTPGINVGEPPVEPTPSAYERVLAMIQSLPEVENRAEAVINDLDNAFRGVAQYLPVGMGNVITAELDGEDSELVSVSDAFKNGKLLGAKVYGKSEQFSTTGTQLLDEENSVAGYIANDGTLNSPTSTDWKASPYMPLLENTKYTLTLDTTAGDTAKHAFYDSNKNFLYYIPSGSQTFLTLPDTAYGRFSFRTETVKPTLNVGEAALPWEPYTGGAPSPNPDYPQEIKSVTEGDLKLTGKCIWGGEQMADDIVAAVNNSTVAYKGEDENGKFVFLKAASSMSAKVFFRVNNIGTYTFIVRAVRVASTGSTLNIKAYRGDSPGVGINFPSGAEVGTIYTWATVTSNTVSILGQYNAGSSKIYYEHSGLFEGSIALDDFVPYAGDFLHFLPDDVEPLRSLPDGTRDILTIDANGNGVIERNVGIIKPESFNNLTFSYSAGTNAKPRNRVGFTNVPNMVNNSDAVINLWSNILKADMSPVMSRSWANRVTIYNGVLYITVDDSIDGRVPFLNFAAEKNLEILYPFASTVTEIIPASRMPKVPSQYLHAWLEAKDQNGEEIVTDYSVYYEKSIGALISQIEQALDAAGYPITDYEPENAMSVAPVLSNDANPVTDTQMAAAVTYGFTLN